MTTTETTQPTDRDRTAVAGFVASIFGNDTELSEQEVKVRIMQLRHCSESAASLSIVALKSVGALVDDEAQAGVTVRRVFKRKHDKRRRENHPPPWTPSNWTL